MRRWLLTTGRHEDLRRLRRELAAHGCRVGDAPIPLGADEQALEVEGPDDLPRRLEKHPGIRKVSPDSDVELFGR